MNMTLQAETTGLDFLILESKSVEVDCLMFVQLLSGETDNRSTSQIAESELSLVGELAGFPCNLYDRTKLLSSRSVVTSNS